MDRSQKGMGMVMVRKRVFWKKCRGVCTMNLTAMLIIAAAMEITGCAGKNNDSGQTITEMTEAVSQEEVSIQEAENMQTKEIRETAESAEIEKGKEEPAADKQAVPEKNSGTGEKHTSQYDSKMTNITEQNAALTENVQTEENSTKTGTQKINSNSTQKNNNTDNGLSNDSGGTTETGNTQSKKDKSQIDPDYKLVWEDDFNGNELNHEDWNIELHDPGWVNQEWQEYVDSDENIYVKDGNLIIQAIKTTKNGKDYYTSGRVNTQNKHDYKYGRFEARAKIPSGKGFLPAFWMMPTDENFYGQWPKCGEIDIMEVLGDNTKTTHGTLHFGEPHTQKQGTYKLAKGDFSSEYHVYACEWEPGEIRFYVDDVLYFTEKDWFTKRTGFGEVAYPAPYDQPFYMILNVAVGGSWVGYPDETTEFGENARLVVDYVKVYQKDEYDENVKKPEHKVFLRNPDKTGNYVNNADFSTEESMEDGKDWEFLTALGGIGKAQITDGELQINTDNAGSADYSIQTVQAGIPLEKGWKYRLSFDAYADEARTMITGITAPDLNYSRYLSDTKVKLNEKSQNYSFNFDMTADSDANGRVEFNLGNQKSTAIVHIDNVRVEKVEKITLKEESKSVLPDGNYVYNSVFNEGSNRLAYWEIDNNCEGAKVYVTNDNLCRELKAEVPETVTALDEVILKQPSVAISGGKKYKFTVDAYSTEPKTIKAKIANKTFDISLTKDKKTYTFVFDTDQSVKNSNLEFLLGVAGITYINNVRIQEDGMIVNGDFVNGTVGYEIYVNESSQVTYGVDELNENSVMGFTIEDTGDQDWMIQLKQNNIRLEQGKWYKITFDAKSDKDRTIMYALQRDGSSDDNWIPYSGTQKIKVNNGYHTYEHVFKMKNDTDERTILSISMGAVNGERIVQKHTVFIDNIILEETDEPQVPDVPENSGMIQNSNFAHGSEHWENAVSEPGKAAVRFEDGKAVYQIENVGTEEWHIQLKQSGITLEHGKQYELSLKLKSDEARMVKAAFLTDSYDWYGGADIELEKDEEKEITVPFYVDKDTDTNITFVLSMGIMAGKDTPATIIEIEEINLKEVSEVQTDVETIEEKQDDTVEEITEEITTEETTTEETTTEESTTEETTIEQTL